jgi:hypothetical protein
MGHVRRRAWLFLLLGAVLAGAPVQAADGPPRAKLRANSQVVPMVPDRDYWSHRAGPDACLSRGSGVIPFAVDDPMMELDHRHARPRLLFLRDRKPRVRRVRAYTDVGRKGAPQGAAARLSAQVAPIRRRREVRAWVVSFRVDASERPYVRVDVGFPRRPGPCSEGGNASYGFGFEVG